MFPISKDLIKFILDSVLLSGVVTRPRPPLQRRKHARRQKRESPWYDIPEGKTLLIDADTLCTDQGKEWNNWMIEQADRKRWGIVFYQKGQLEFRNEDVKLSLAMAAKQITGSMERILDWDNFVPMI